MALPCSSNSALDTHIDLKVARLARIDPPTKVELIRSGGAEILIFVCEGDRERTSCNMRSPNPGKSVEPPANTTCENRVDLKSISLFIIEFTKT